MHKFVLLLSGVFALPAAAEMRAHALPGPGQIQLDGRLDEAAWAQAPRHAEFFEHTPNDGRPAAQPTAMRIAYDAQYLYVGLEAVDPEPGAIREPFARRDKVLGDQDFFVFYLDTAGDGKAAQFFRVNPRGAIGDGMFTDTGGEDFSPDYDFEAVASRTPAGWSAELRIPFSALSYNAGMKAWRVMLLRSLTRGDRYRLTSGPAPRSTNCFLCYSSPLQALSPPAPAANWTFTPQWLASHAERTRPDGSRTVRKDSELSLDVKVRPRSDWVLDLTVNPDFSQVELDAPALAGNSRFAVFLPEKRPFFLEGADLLQSPFPDEGTLQAVHSRSITDPAWGSRATWRGEQADVTVLTARDNGGGVAVLPGAYGNDFASQDYKSQATVARASLRDGRWQYGGLLTDRTLAKGRGYNRLIGAESSWQADEHTRLRSQLLWSETTAIANAEQRLERGAARQGHALYLDGSRQWQDWDLFARFKDIGADFRADNGFITQTGIRSLQTELTRKFGHEASWRETNPYFNTEYVQDRAGRVVSQKLTPGLFLAGPYDSFFNLEWHGKERSRQAADAPLLKRDYVHLYADGAPGQLLNRLTTTLELGDQIDYGTGRLGRGGFASLFARMRLHPRLELEQNLDRVWVDGGAQQRTRAFSELAYQWNSIWHFSARDTARLIWQRAHSERKLDGQGQPVAERERRNTWSLVYAHRRGLGRALYVGATLADAREGEAPRDERRELFVKASWAL